MTSTTKPASTRSRERETHVPYRDVRAQVKERFKVPMAVHGKSSKGGGQQFYPSIEGLRLADDSERYRCKVGRCQHTYTTWGKVRTHIGRDHPNPAKTARQARKAAAAASAVEPPAEPVLPEHAPTAEPAPVVEPSAELTDDLSTVAAAAPEPVVVPPPDTPLTESGLDQMVKTFGALAASRNEWRDKARTEEKGRIAAEERAERAEAELAELRKRLAEMAGV